MKTAKYKKPHAIIQNPLFLLGSSSEKVKKISRIVRTGVLNCECKIGIPGLRESEVFTGIFRTLYQSQETSAVFTANEINSLVGHNHRGSNRNLTLGAARRLREALYTFHGCYRNLEFVQTPLLDIKEKGTGRNIRFEVSLPGIILEDYMNPKTSQILDFEVYLSIRNKVGRRFYEFLERRRQQKQVQETRLFEIKTDLLCQWLPITQKHLSQQKRVIIPALDELTLLGYITCFNFFKDVLVIEFPVEMQVDEEIQNVSQLSESSLPGPAEPTGAGTLSPCSAESVPVGIGMEITGKGGAGFGTCEGNPGAEVDVPITPAPEMQQGGGVEDVSKSSQSPTMAPLSGANFSLSGESVSAEPYESGVTANLEEGVSGGGFTREISPDFWQKFNRKNGLSPEDKDKLREIHSMCRIPVESVKIEMLRWFRLKGPEYVQSNVEYTNKTCKRDIDYPRYLVMALQKNWGEVLQKIQEKPQKTDKYQEEKDYIFQAIRDRIGGDLEEGDRFYTQAFRAWEGIEPEKFIAKVKDIMGKVNGKHIPPEVYEDKNFMFVVLREAAYAS